MAHEDNITEFTRDDQLDNVQVEMVGNPNSVRVDHTARGMKVTFNMLGGVESLKVVKTPFEGDNTIASDENLAVDDVEYANRDTRPTPNPADDDALKKKSSTGETATLGNAQATAADPQIEDERREIRDEQAEGHLPGPGGGVVPGEDPNRQP
jgi:hypothetical protein